jgi:hypothetical protein
VPCIGHACNRRLFARVVRNLILLQCVSSHTGRSQLCCSQRCVGRWTCIYRLRTAITLTSSACCAACLWPPACPPACLLRALLFFQASFDMAKAWDGRCRKWYADRYDFRTNMVRCTTIAVCSCLPILRAVAWRQPQHLSLLSYVLAYQNSWKHHCRCIACAPAVSCCYTCSVSSPALHVLGHHPEVCSLTKHCRALPALHDAVLHFRLTGTTTCA